MLRRNIQNQLVKSKNGKLFSRLQISGATNAASIITKALQTSISASKDPLKSGPYSEAYFEYIRKKRSDYCQPSINRSVEIEEKKSTQNLFSSGLSTRYNYVEKVVGLNTPHYARSTNFPLVGDCNNFRFPDKLDYQAPGIENDDFEIVHNLREDEMYGGQGSHHFVNTYGLDDHFEKFSPSIVNQEFVGKLGDDEILIANAILLKISALKSYLRDKFQIYPLAIYTNKNYLGQIISYRIKLSAEDLLKVKDLKEASLNDYIGYRKLSILSKQDWSTETAVFRTIVISNLGKYDNPQV